MANRYGKLRQVLALLVLEVASLSLVTSAVAAGQLSPQGEKLRHETQQRVREHLAGPLAQYCRDACSIIDLRVDVDEQITESEDLGFEGVAGEDLGRNLIVSKIVADIQVDDRVNSANRDRLLTILKNALQPLGSVVEISWRPVTMPQIGMGGAKEDQLKHNLEQRVTTAIDKVIETYCPEECVLSNVAVDGKLVTAEEATDIPPEQLVHEKSGGAILKVEAVDVDVAMDTSMPPEVRARISNVMRAKTRFASPLNLDVQVVAFPESYAKKQEKEQRKSEDPFGLGKLREMLKMFKELAGTKEIVSTTTTNTNSRDHNATTAKEASLTKESSTAQTTATTAHKDNLTTAVEGKPKEWEYWQWAAMIAGVMILAGLVYALVARFTAASRDAKLMMMAAGLKNPAAAGAEPGKDLGVPNLGGGVAVANAAGLSDGQRKDMALKLRNEELREELIKVFMDQPRVAKETFSRLLLEEGIEETARYVHIFGHMIVFELLGDPNLQRNLNDLSEYYHKSEFSFSPEEENKLLTVLKTRVTANEIRLLARRQLDKFEFLQKLDATQVFTLIKDEKPQVQSIVLTQLDHKRRRAVFDMYVGEAKVDLMRELCRADALPKEFLANVAKALHKKITARPEFDTENLRASDILLDLLEKAVLEEQKALMRNLMSTNPEAARAIKMKLVTTEVMPYLKDGHLLEIMMGMEREDLMTFLAGAPDHIRSLILGKAPDDLADSWIEDLNNFRGVQEQNYRLVEMKVLGRIRNLAVNGVINLIDINDMIFGKSGDSGAAKVNGQGSPAATNAMRPPSPSSMVA